MNRANRKTVSDPLLAAIPGAIRSDAVYRADEAKIRMGWRDAGFRAACRRGLKTHRCGKRTYVTGAALLEFITGGKGGAT
jgi:hypothetical protein